MMLSKNPIVKLIELILISLVLCTILGLLFWVIMVNQFDDHTSVWQSIPTNPSKDISLHLPELNKVIKLAQSEQMKAEDHNFHIKILPPEYGYLSDSGEIIVEKPKQNIKIFFYTFRGMMSGSNGYIFTADGDPNMYEESNFETVKKINPHWYWVSTKD